MDIIGDASLDFGGGTSKNRTGRRGSSSGCGVAPLTQARACLLMSPQGTVMPERSSCSARRSRPPPSMPPGRIGGSVFRRHHGAVTRCRRKRASPCSISGKARVSKRSRVMTGVVNQWLKRPCCSPSASRTWKSLRADRPVGLVGTRSPPSSRPGRGGFRRRAFRACPNCVVRRGSDIARGVVVMPSPSFNLGAICL